MKNLDEVRRKRASLVKEARDLVTLSEKENRNLTPEEKTKCDKALDEANSLDLDIKREERLQQIEMANAPKAKATGESEKEKRDIFFKFIREGKASLNREQRALVEDAQGLILVPEDLETEIYRGLPQLNVIRQLATVRQTARDKVRRRSLTELSVGWGKLETGNLLNESNMTPDQDYIYVEDLYGLTKVGEDELMDNDDIIAGIIADSFRRAIADAEAKAFVIGTGHANLQPDGVTLDATVISTYTDLDTADTVVPNDLLDIEYALPAQYRQGATFLMNTSTALQVRKVVSATGPYLWQPSLQIGMPQGFDGYPVQFSPDMIIPASTNVDRSIVVVFGNWKAGYVIVDRLGVSLKRLDELYAEDGLVGFMVHFRVGGGVVRPDAFRALDNNT